MKFLLTTLNAKYIHLNLAIRLLYAINKDKENLFWHEFTIKENPNDIAQYCSDYGVIAFSCYIWNITQTLAVAQLIKQLNPDCKIVLGGPEVSYDWQEVINLPYIDYIIVGEGEIPFTDFLNNYPNTALVPNLVSKVEGHIHYMPAEITFDLKNFENINPYIFDDPKDLYNKVCYIETSRGCPYKCEFCLASLDNKVRYLPINNIKNNLLYLMQNGRVIKFLDRTFNIKKDFTLDIFQFILDNHLPKNVFQFEITADILHPDIIHFINTKVPKNLFRFEIGIQSVNQEANLEVNRKQNFEKTSQIIKQVEDTVELHLDLIVGLPLDYWAQTKHSFEAVFKLFAPELQLGFLKFLKGTPVRERYEQYGYKFDPIAPYQIIESNFLSKDELHQITLLEHALEIYWNKKRTLQTLRYVTLNHSVFDFLLGLGKHFASKLPLHKYSLQDVYDVAFEYATIAYPDDLVLKELIAIDYYFQFQVRPKELYIQALDKKNINDIVEKNQLNIHKYRYIIFPISFNYAAFAANNSIIVTNQNMIIQYTGISKPSIINELPDNYSF